MKKHKPESRFNGNLTPVTVTFPISSSCRRSRPATPQLPKQPKASLLDRILGGEVHVPSCKLWLPAAADAGRDREMPRLTEEFVKLRDKLRDTSKSRSCLFGVFKQVELPQNVSIMLELRVVCSCVCFMVRSSLAEEVYAMSVSVNLSLSSQKMSSVYSRWGSLSLVLTISRDVVQSEGTTY